MPEREKLCLIAVTLFSLSGGLILQLPREDRLTLFIFPAFLSTVIGGSLAVYGLENFVPWRFLAAAAVPLLLVLPSKRVAPAWATTSLSYLALLGAIICSDLLLDMWNSGWR